MTPRLLGQRLRQRVQGARKAAEILCGDPAGNIKPDKKKSTEKIDGAVAAVTALDRVVRNGRSTGSVYDEKGFCAFSLMGLRGFKNLFVYGVDSHTMVYSKLCMSSGKHIYVRWNEC